MMCRHLGLCVPNGTALYYVGQRGAVAYPAPHLKKTLPVARPSTFYVVCRRHIVLLEQTALMPALSRQRECGEHRGMEARSVGDEKKFGKRSPIHTEL